MLRFGILFCCLSLSLSAFANPNRAVIQTLKAHLELLTFAPDGAVLQTSLDKLAQPEFVTNSDIEQIEQQIADYWHAHEVSLPYSELPATADLLSKALALEPKNSNYIAVKSHIQFLLWLDNSPWLEKISSEMAIRPGDESLLVSNIAQKLLLLGDLDSYNFENNYYDDKLVEGVKNFQARHGLSVDGVIGKNTLKWLNVSPEDRVRIIADNFVKQAQYKQDITANYVLVNIPAFELIVVEDNKLIMQSKVIVGRKARQTPVMKSEISNIVLNPTWTLPVTIQRRDILPKIRQDISYLEEHRFTVYTLEGEELTSDEIQQTLATSNGYSLRIVQKAGDDNALGRYKFHFANSQSIYLHDTPNKTLFNRSNRAISSGCVRVEKVEELANWMANKLVVDKRTWDRMQPDHNTTKWFSFEHKLPVHLVYWTAWIDSNRNMQFRDNVYDM